MMILPLGRHKMEYVLLAKHRYSHLSSTDPVADAEQGLGWGVARQQRNYSLTDE
jgi:hypothetical protein